MGEMELPASHADFLVNFEVKSLERSGGYGQ